MTKSHRLSKILFYVFSCFIMLYSNNIKAQEKEGKILKKVSSYFGQLKKDHLQVCLNSESSESLKTLKKEDKKMYDAFMDECNERVSIYGLYETDTKSLLKTLYKNGDSDFIIVNMINPNNRSVFVSKSNLTFSRKKDDKEIHIINNHYEDNEETNRYELLKDSLISDFNVEEKMKLIEDYLYYNKWNAISEKNRKNQFASGSYYVVAKVNGKFLIKELLDYTSKK